MESLVPDSWFHGLFEYIYHVIQSPSKITHTFYYCPVLELGRSAQRHQSF